MLQTGLECGWLGGLVLGVGRVSVGGEGAWVFSAQLKLFSEFLYVNGAVLGTSAYKNELLSEMMGKDCYQEF